MTKYDGEIFMAIGISGRGWYINKGQKFTAVASRYIRSVSRISLVSTTGSETVEVTFVYEPDINSYHGRTFLGYYFNVGVGSFDRLF